MISVKNKEQCYGCGACAHVCPKSCIEMKADEEGFLYPKVKEDTCIKCGKCINVCPYHRVEENNIQDIYAARNRDESVRKISSSGGVFYFIAKSVLEENGIVFGCAFDEEMTAKHIKVTKLEELYKLHGSKYVQSEIGETFVHAEEALKSGKKVLYSGTPCQIAGLKNYLSREYQNLITVDVLCHGTPSPSVFKAYKKGIEKKYQSKIVNINLRDKKKSWKRLFTEIKFENGERFYKFCGYDTYMSMFLNNMSQRPSCFACKFTTNNRQGDISLGDYWGIGKYISEMDDDKGTSLVIINSNKGKEVWNQIKEQFIVRKTNYEVAEAGNKVLCQPPKKNEHRDDFYRTFEADGYEAAAKKWVRIPSKPEQIYYDIMRKCLDFYRFVFHKKY